MVADIEELENLDASQIRARRPNAKEVLMPKMVTFSYSRSQMEQSSCLVDMRFSEDPSTRGILHEAKNTTTFFKESRTDFNH